MNPIPEYLRKIEKVLTAGNATEHTYRPSLQTLVESMAPDISAANEPKRKQYGAPDYIVSRAAAPIGYIEAKNIGKPLDVIEREEFLHSWVAVINNPRVLVIRMAVLARLLRATILEIFAVENSGGTLHAQMEGFRCSCWTHLDIIDFLRDCEH